MDLAFLFVFPALIWVQAWYLLGFYTNPRALGLIAAVVGILLFAVVLFQDNIPMAIKAPSDLGDFVNPATAFSAFVLVWVVYSVMVAGVYLWGLDTRSLGFYSLFLSVISVLFAVYFFLGDRILDDGEVVNYTWLMGVVAIMLAILQALVSIYLVPQRAGMGEPSSSGIRTVTGFFHLVFSIAIVLLGGLLLLGINPLL